MRRYLARGLLDALYEKNIESLSKGQGYYVSSTEPTGVCGGEVMCATPYCDRFGCEPFTPDIPLMDLISDGYLTKMPIDPDATFLGGMVQDAGFRVWYDENTKQITVEAIRAEEGEVIKYSR